MIKHAISNAFAKRKSRNYEFTYWAIDLHDTCIKSTYNHDNIDFEFYPYVIETLQYLSNNSSHKLILWTCSNSDSIEYAKEQFAKHNIIFDYINENPECPNRGVSCFDNKFYFDIVIDDKAGFQYTEWKYIKLHVKLMESFYGI